MSLYAAFTLNMSVIFRSAFYPYAGLTFCNPNGLRGKFSGYMSLPKYDLGKDNRG